MDIFKQAAMLGLRIPTLKGQLSVEQVCTLNTEELDGLAVSLEAGYNESGKKSFRTKTTAKDKTAKLRFDIVLDILNTKMDAEEKAAEALEIKQHNEKIINLITDKENQTLAGKSVKQLQAMLR